MVQSVIFCISGPKPKNDLQIRKWLKLSKNDMNDMNNSTSYLYIVLYSYMKIYMTKYSTKITEIINTFYIF